jgi:hypothetical protein
MENKTQPGSGSVDKFIDQLEDPQKKQDSRKILEIMKEITGEPPVMWGETIIGFDKYRYKYASGREGEWMATGFSPRKQNLTIYLNYGFENKKEFMDKLGKFKTGKACLYIKKLDNVDEKVLRNLIKDSYLEVKKNSHV